MENNYKVIACTETDRDWNAEDENRFKQEKGVFYSQSEGTYLLRESTFNDLQSKYNFKKGVVLDLENNLDGWWIKIPSAFLDEEIEIFPNQVAEEFLEELDEDELENSADWWKYIEKSINIYLLESFLDDITANINRLKKEQQ